MKTFIQIMAFAFFLIRCATLQAQDFTYGKSLLSNDKYPTINTYVGGNYLVTPNDRHYFSTEAYGDYSFSNSHWYIGGNIKTTFSTYNEDLLYSGFFKLGRRTNQNNIFVSVPKGPDFYGKILATNIPYTDNLVPELHDKSRYGWALGAQVPTWRFVFYTEYRSIFDQNDQYQSSGEFGADLYLVNQDEGYLGLSYLLNFPGQDYFENGLYRFENDSINNIPLLGIKAALCLKDFGQIEASMLGLGNKRFMDHVRGQITYRQPMDPVMGSDEAHLFIQFNFLRDYFYAGPNDITLYQINIGWQSYLY